MSEAENINPEPEFSGMSAEEAAARLTQLEEQATTSNEDDTSEEVETDLQAVEDDNQADQDPEAEDDEDEEDESEDSESDEDDSDDEELEGFEFDGEFVSVEQLKEWRDSGLRQQDYTKKTQEVAETKKALAADAEKLSEMSKQYEQEIVQMQQVIAAQMHLDGHTDQALQELKKQDFDEYLRVKDQVEERRNLLHGLFQQQQQNEAQRQQLEQAARAQRLNEAYQTIQDRIPEYADETKGKEIRSNVAELLTSDEFGFSAQELDGIEDPRMFLVAHALYEARSKSPTKAAKEVAKKKSQRSVSPVIKSGTRKTNNQRRSEKAKKAMGGINKGISVEEAANLLNSLS